jgi:hypothetical protein
MIKIIKTLAKIILALTTLLGLMVLFIFLRFDKAIPAGVQGEEADRLAHAMLDELSYENYKATDFLSWTFRGKRSYEWSRKEGKCIVSWEKNKVLLVLDNTQKSKVYINDIVYSGPKKSQLVDQALSYFNNDSFWLVAPYKVLDPGVERRYIETAEGQAALLVSYTTGGSTPGDTYLWHFDAQGVPTSFQLWVNLIPIGGLSASWEDWKATSSGAKIASFHQISFLGIELTDIQGIKYD